MVEIKELLIKSGYNEMILNQLIENLFQNDLYKVLNTIVDYFIKCFPDGSVTADEVDLEKLAIKFMQENNDYTLAFAILKLSQLPEVDIRYVLNKLLEMFRSNGIRKISFKKFSAGLPSNIHILNETCTLEVDDNVFILNEVSKKENDEYDIKTNFIFKLLSNEKIIDKIENKTFYLIKAMRFKGNDAEDVEIDDIEDIEKIMSSHIISKIKRDIELYNKLTEKVKDILKKSATTVVKNSGFGIIEDGDKLVIPDIYTTKRLEYSENFENFWEDWTKEEKIYNYEKQKILKYLSAFTGGHNLTVIGAFFASHLIHIVKPKIVPLVFLWGDSGVGKSSSSALLCYATVSQSQSTTHQWITEFSGFRNGVILVDEKIEWKGEVIQTLKSASTSLGLIKRKYKEKLFKANVVIVSTSNPKPLFKVKGLEDLKGIVRRGVFLEVSKELDYIPGIETKYEYLELNKMKVIRVLISELLNIDVETIKKLWEAIKIENIKEKYKLIVLGLKIWELICKNNGVNIEIDYVGLLKRWEESEKEIVGLGEYSLIDIIKPHIIQEIINIAQKLRFSEFNDVDILIDSKSVVKALLQTKEYGIIKKDDGQCYIVFTNLGWDNLSKEIEKLPELHGRKDIINYLRSMGAEFEEKNTHIHGIKKRWFVLPIKESVDTELKNLEDLIISTLKEVGEINYLQLVEKLSEHGEFSEDEIEQAIENLKRLGDICEPRPGVLKLI